MPFVWGHCDLEEHRHLVCPSRNLALVGRLDESVVAMNQWRGKRLNVFILEVAKPNVIALIAKRVRRDFQIGRFPEAGRIVAGGPNVDEMIRAVLATLAALTPTAATHVHP